MADRRFQIVPMKRVDLDEVMVIEESSHQSPWVRQIFVEELDRSWAHVDLLRTRPQNGGELLAFVNYWLVRDEVHILNVATRGSARRQGHAARLLEHVIGFAHRKQARYLTLEVRRSNLPANRLYRKYGFRAVGIRPNYYVDNREDAVVMLLDLGPDDPV